MFDYIIAIFCGFITGLLSGLFGIGGSIISTPALRLAMNTSAEIALGTPLPVIIPTALFAGYNFVRAKMVDKRLVFFALPAGILGTVTGSYTTKYIDARYLMIATAGLLIYSAVRFIKTANDRDVSGCFSRAKVVAIGFAAGFVSGLLGVGGGIILIPGFHLILGVPVQVAMGSSLIIIAVMAIPGSIIHYLLEHVDVTLFLGLTSGVIPASFLGSKISVNIKAKLIKKAFGIFLFIVGVVFVLYELNDFGFVMF